MQNAHDKNKKFVSPEDIGQSRREKIIIISLSVSLIVSIIISLGIGRYNIPLTSILEILKSLITGSGNFSDEKAAVVVQVVRLPRILLSALVGASLSASGVSYQGLFKNPMVSPDILGVSAGAGVGASIAILMDFSSITVQLMAFSFGIGAVLLVLGLSKSMGRGNSNLLIMVLAGMVISSLFSSCNALIKYLSVSSDKLPEITFWLMGSFAKCGSYENVTILLITTTVGILPLMMLRWKINVLSFGEEEAQAMGVNINFMKFFIIICSTLLSASSIAMCGMIGWVGLTIPHITRLMVGPNYKVLLPTSMIAGALFMVIVDDLSRTLTSGEIPIGVITSLVGAPIFIYLMYNGRRGWL